MRDPVADVGEPEVVTRGTAVGASQQFEHAALHILDEYAVPVGSGTLAERLDGLGMRVSEPTVGRLLRALDRRGLTTRVSNKGRNLTEAGRARLDELRAAETRFHYERELLRTIRSQTMDEILDVLVARRALERETARLAAEHATDESIAQLEAAILEQQDTLRQHRIAVDADVRFHALVAQLAGNRVLTAAVDLIRRDSQLTLLLDAMLRRTSHKWVVGHEDVAAAIKRRDPDAAEQAMLAHINAVIADVQTYYRRVKGKNPRTRL